MEIHVSSYTPEWHNRLLEYMKEVYPHRNTSYFEWWLTNIDHSDEECWEKCTIIMEGSCIIGCTTVNDVLVLMDSTQKKIFFRGNTIISPNQRGKGISKKIYNRVNLYNNWISVGVTDIAWKIQPKYVNEFTPINPVNVYVSLNLFGFVRYHVWRLLRRNTLKECKFPFYFDLGEKEELMLVEKLEDMTFPKNGKWNEDDFEIIRDKNYFKWRFYDIYRSDKYHIYKYLSDGTTIGYLVLRNIVYKGLDMVSLVDFRFRKRDYETRALKAATKVAGTCGIGLVMTLTSRRWGYMLSPLTIMTKKKLHRAVGMKDYAENFNEMLITSADSDLDFVYYK